MSVLVVDDKDENREYLRAVLEAYGFEVESATNGAEALASARRRLPELVISDLLMPIMDGYMLLRQWKLDSVLKSIPFAVYTAIYSEAEDEQLALDMGVDAFIQQPLEPDSLVAELRRALAKPARLPPDSMGMDRDSLHSRYTTTLLRKLEEKSRQLETSNRDLLRGVSQRASASDRQIAVLNALPAHVALIDVDGIIVSVNESWRRYAAANLLPAPGFGVGQNYLSVCAAIKGADAAEAQFVAERIRAVLDGSLSSFLHEYACSSPLEEHWFRMMVTPLIGYELSGAVVMHIDVSDRKAAELRLRESQQQYLLLLNSTSEGIYGLDLEGNCTFCNPAAARFLGLLSPDELVGERVHDLLHHTSPAGQNISMGNCRIHGVFQAGEATHGDDEVFFRKDGSSFPVEFWSHPIRRADEVVGSVVTFLDISERRDLEAKFLQSQKMEAIGRLAGGIAHDFNNCLQVVLTRSELLDEMLGERPIEREYLQAIQTAGQRGAALTRQLLAFSRKELVVPQVIDLNVVVADIEGMLRPMIGEDIRLGVTRSPTACIIRADVKQLEQLLMNLAVNARDAMPTGGTLFISTEVVERAAQRHAVLTIRDSGRGMDAATQSHMYEPFFTTKEAGRGTGLGLATVYGIVKHSGGFIEVDSELGEGTTFRVYFPTTTDMPTRTESPAPAERLRGVESILLVEDESALLTLLASTLRGHGYTVFEANGGAAALAVATKPGLQLHLLVTDVILADLSGPQIADRVLLLHPKISVLYISGYTGNRISSAALDGGARLLEKPFSIGALLTKVSEALDEQPRPPAP